MMVNELKVVVRAIRDTFRLTAQYIYDFWRYMFFSALIFRSGRRAKVYKLIKIYHSVEKGLSFTSREKGRGISNVRLLINQLAAVRINCSSQLSVHELASLSNLQNYLENSPTISEEDALRINRVLEKYPINKNSGGVRLIGSENFNKSKLSDPEAFFLSRYTIRDFSERSVDETDLIRALELAAKTPSSCNRQVWHTYIVKGEKKIKKALSYQNGNSGFGDRIPLLLVICSDLKAFEGASERHQPFVDGGMYACSLVMAFHSLGLGTCCLNWSQPISKDRRLRKELRINASHQVIMMMGVGYPTEAFKVCFSAKTPVEETISLIEGDL